MVMVMVMAPALCSPLLPLPLPLPLRRTSQRRRLPLLCSASPSSTPSPNPRPSQHRTSFSFSLRNGACSLALALALLAAPAPPSLHPPALAAAVPSPALPDLSVLISGPPIKDPGALLRYALPIKNKAIREVQKPLEDITDSLRIAGLRALDSVERNVRQASRALDQGNDLILAGLAESKREQGKLLLQNISAGLDDLQKIVEDRNRDAVAPKQKELLQYVGSAV